MKILPALALSIEGALTALWLTRLLSTLAAYDGFVLALIAARSLAGALQLTSASWLLSHRLAAPTLAAASLVVSALLRVVEVGLRQSPSNLDPSFRWHFVIAYALYAAVMVVLLTRGRTSK